MFRVELCYPCSDDKDAFFNVDYYKNTHMPWAKGLLGGDEIIKDTSIEMGVPMGEGMKPAYICKGVIFVEDLQVFFGKMMAASGEFMGDVPNFTNVGMPSVQVYQVV